MNFQAYLGLSLVLAGLAMAVREVARRKHADALKSGGVSLIGALLVTAGVMDGKAAIAAALGLGVLGIALIYAARRVSRRQAN